MPSKFGGIPVTPQTGGSKFGGIPVAAPSAAPTASAPEAGGDFWGDFAHELWQQGGQPLLEGLQNHPIATLAHLLGSAAGISTGTTPVPGPRGQVQVGGPTQMAEVADVAERGPAAIAAATTLSALPIAIGLGGKAASASRIGQATKAAAAAGKEALPNAIETSALRYTGLPQLVRPMVKAFKGSMGETKPQAAPPAPAPDPVALAAAARAAELEEFAPGFSKLSAREQAITEMAYNRIKNGPPAASPPPPGRIAPLYQAPAQPEAAPPAEAQPTPSPKAAAEAVPEAAAPRAQPRAPKPPPQAPQTTERPGESTAEALFRAAQESGTVPATAKPGEPFGGTVSEPEPFIQAARGKRALNAETLTNAFKDYGFSSEDLRDMSPKDWESTATKLGLDFPKDKTARQKLIDATIQRFEGGGTATVRIKQGARGQ